MPDSIDDTLKPDDFVDFCHLNPALTNTDTSDLEVWLNRNNIPFRHRSGPGGDTVFQVQNKEYARAVQLYGDYRGSADYILAKNADPTKKMR